MLTYLVDWGNGFVGGYTEDFNQQFNTPKREVFDVLKTRGISSIKIITPLELDELRGFHKPTSQEYFHDMHKKGGQKL